LKLFLLSQCNLNVPKVEMLNPLQNCCAANIVHCPSSNAC